MKRKICIVYSLYNENITKRMFERAVKLLKSKGITSIKILEVPGSFEIPQVLSRVINKFDGFIVIGCIIKGKTKNFDLICSAITNGIMDLSIKNKKPIGNGLITSFNEQQALKRLNNGKEATQAVLDVLKIF